MSVQIAIDNYDDLFSDFDIRDYSERYISSDFLNELRLRANKVKNENDINIIFIVGDKERNVEYEKIIAGRLKTFFNNRYERNKNKRRKILLGMFLFELIGIIFMLLAIYIEKYASVYLKDFLLIPSWFFIWNGFEKYINNKKIVDRNIKYYSKLIKSTITFKS